MNAGAHYIGKAGEYAVASQLLMRGIVVHFPAIDVEGVDLIAGGQVRIQVKSSRKNRGGRDHYMFGLRGGPAPNGKKRECREWHKKCDFMVFWGADENRFWVIPSALFAPPHNVQTLLLGSTHRKHADHVKIRELFEAGMRQSEIATLFGLSPSTVSAGLKGRIKNFDFGISGDCNRYENAWHEIESAIRLTKQIDVPLANAEITTGSEIERS